MQKACVETVSCSNRIDRIDRNRGTVETLGSALRNCALAAQFHHDQRYNLRELLYGRFEIADSSGFLGLPLVRQEYVDISQHLIQPAFPSVVGIVVGVQ